LALVAAMLRQTLKAVSRGDLAAILAVAFDPLVRLVLDACGRTPEEVLEQRCPRPLAHPDQNEIRITDDESAALVWAKAADPALVFDLRCWHNGHADKLLRLPGYAGVDSIEPATARILVWLQKRIGGTVIVLGSAEWLAAQEIIGAVPCEWQGR
jgi:hypothetical protein